MSWPAFDRFLGNALTTMLLHISKTSISFSHVLLYKSSDHRAWCCAWFCRSSWDKPKTPLLSWGTGPLTSMVC